jgi:hypothetical protein
MTCSRAAASARSCDRLGRRVSEVVVERDFAFYRYLVGGDAAFKKIGELLDVWQLHEAEGIFCAEDRRDAHGFEAAVGYVAQVFEHVFGGVAAYAQAQDVLGEGHFAVNCFLQHLHRAGFETFVEEIGLLRANRADYLEGELDVGAFVAQDPERDVWLVSTAGVQGSTERD